MAISKKTSTGATKRTKGSSKGSSTSKKVKTETKQEARVLDKVASAVQKRIEKKGLSPAMKVPKNILVLAGSTDISFLQGYGTNNVAFLPVTWAVPTQRHIDDPADDRHTDSLSIHLKGARVRFTVVYKDAFRIRMALYKATTVAAFHQFRAVSLPGVTHPVPDQAFALDWVANNHLSVIEGPFGQINADRGEGSVGASGRAPPPLPQWLLDSGDGTLFTADQAKGVRKPIDTFELWRSSPSGGFGIVNVDWYVPIEKVVRRIRELDKVIWGDVYQILFYYDCPGFEVPTPAPVVFHMRWLTVKVYYR
jgi:hypothetical protein